MWDPNDGMSPMNPFSAPNQLMKTERATQEITSRQVQANRDYIARMDALNSRGHPAGLGSSSVPPVSDSKPIYNGKRGGSGAWDVIGYWLGVAIGLAVFVTIIHFS